MSFYSEIDNLLIDVKTFSGDDSDMKKLIQRSKLLAQSFFPSDNRVFQVLGKVSIEPKGIYYPEMYEKEKIKAVANCKESLVNFIQVAKDQFERSLVDKPFEEIIKHDESQLLEFKSTLCWDIKNSKDDKRMMGEIIMKSISALSNSEGGVLLIGVKDDQTILGLSDDYKTFKNGSGNRDDFELHLTTLLVNNFSKTFAKDNLSIEFTKSGEKEICLVRVRKGETPYTIKVYDKSGQQKEKYFIRVNNSSRDIDDLIEFARYIRKRFPDWN